MSHVKQNITELIGNTPLLQLNNYAQHIGAKATIIAKLESFNPSSSVKDRIALAMVEDALKQKKISEHAIIIEPTSGNTGIGLAMIGAAKKIRIILTMPDTMSIERRNLLALLGAELVLTPGALGMKGAIEKAKEIQQETPNAIILGQFENPANPAIHYHTTAVEIWKDTAGKIDIFVGGVGTGGTISGVGKRLKEYNPNIHTVAVEPVESPVLSGGTHSPHKIQGIGAGFEPINFNREYVDEIITISTQEAMDTMKSLAQTEGVLAGISSGAALAATAKLALRPEYQGKTIVVVLPDTGERYLSMLQ